MTNLIATKLTILDVLLLLKRVQSRMRASVVPKPD